MNDVETGASLTGRLPDFAKLPSSEAAVERPIVMVVGMHRSGTSLCSHILSALGIDMTDSAPGPGLEAPGEDNPKGHWERWELVGFHDRILHMFNQGFYSPFHDFALPVAWWADPKVAEVRREITAFLKRRMGEAAFGFKDPRTVRLMPMWHQIAAELRLVPKIIYCLRNPAQVARSVRARDKMSLEVGEYRWFCYNLEFFQYMKSLQFCTIEYEKWFADPGGNLEKLKDFLEFPAYGPEFDVDSAISGIVEREFRHDDPGLGGARQPLIRSLYDLARRAERDPTTRHQIQGIATQFQSFQQLQTVFRRQLEESRRQLEESTSEAANLAAKVPVLEEAAAGLRRLLSEREAQLSAARADNETALARAAESEVARTHAEQSLAETEAARNRAEAALVAWEARASGERATIHELRCHNAAFAQSLAQQRAEKEALEQSLVVSGDENEAMREQNRLLHFDLERLRLIEMSTTWRATARLRTAANRLPQPVRRHLRRAARAAYWALTPHKMPARIRYLRNRRRTRTIAGRTGSSEANDTAADYARWIEQYDTITDGDRNAIRTAIARLVDPPLISVVMPVYETPEPYLRAALDSVCRQLYPNWELCIADDASTARHIRQVLEEYRALDKRINVSYRSENGHISQASNTALASANGQFVAFLDHDDVLPEHALYMIAAALAENPELDLIFSDEDKIDSNGNRYDPYFKSDWNPDLMLSQNMFSHLGVYRRSLIDAICGFRAGYEGSQDYDLVLRASTRTTPERIHHIPHILYHWRAIPGSVALRKEEKAYATANARRAIADHLAESSIAAIVSASAAPGYHRVQYPLPEPAPRVSLLVPTGGNTDLLRTCVTGILDRTDYDPFELIVLHNTETRREVFPYLEELSRDPRVRIIDTRCAFNFSRICNIGAGEAKGELVALINDDLEMIDPGWLREMASHAVRPEVGAVGALLYYPTGHIQHAGVLVGLGGVAGHPFLQRPRGDFGYFGRASVLQNVSAVTGACLVMPRALYTELGGLDETNLAVAFNDVDLCLRIREKGYRIVWTPYAELYHHESATRRSDFDSDQIGRFRKEIAYMERRWGAALRNDPHYNPNLSLELPGFELSSPPRIAKPWKRVEPIVARDALSKKGPIVSQMEAASTGAVSLATPEPPLLLPVLPTTEMPQRHESVDIIICVHNALDDVRQCLHSVIEKTSPPYRLIIVDDGSGEAMRDYLIDFAGIHDTLLLRNEQALGYTFAANIGLRASNASWVVLLNSDTVVTEPWIEAMWRHGWRDPNVGVIGPLSNAASWQSVPHIRAGDDWAINNLPDGMTPQDVADCVRTVAVGAREMPFLNGFCYMIRRAVIDQIGLFDETSFGSGYGEENDYSIRTRQAGYKLIVATDAYVFHAHSSSYTSERRRELAKQADVKLIVKHDPARHIYSQAQYCASSLVFTSVRARVQAALRRRELIEQGRRDFEGRRIAFILPVVEYGGGANVVLQEARALNSMGVDVAVLNLAAFVQQLAKYGIPEVPRFISCLDEIEIRKHIEETNVPYDGVIATAYSSMYWLPDKSRKDARFGYYIQDYEPRFFPETDPRHSRALATYSLRDDVRLFTKTAWNQQAIANATKSVPEVVGCSLDLNLFAPEEEWAMAAKDRPVRIAAMLRPSTPRRAPARTLAVLNEIVRRYPDQVSIHAFGGTDEELHSSGLHQPWITNHGPLHPTKLAKLLGSCDIFVDFSDYQAMGLTLLESMASGCAAIGPIEGGATSFVQSGVNGFLVDTASLDECIEKTDLLVRDADLRMNLQHQAIDESSRHLPEAAALNILRCLFQ